MPTLLHIDSSPLGNASISRHLSEEFVQNWLRQHPVGKVIVRDLSANPPPVITAEWIGASFTPEEARTPEQRETLALSDTLIGELETADEYVVGVPMHNFTIAAGLRLWIDQVARPGKTFAFVDGRPTGILKGKKATFLVASGGVYGPGSATASYNFVEPYLRTFFGFLGVVNAQSYAAGGASVVNHGEVDRETFLHPHIAAVQELFPAAA
jgi:FMN-dependent NADH-azoreductase